MRLRNLLSLSLLALATPFVAACGDDGTTEPALNARIRVVHASPGAPAVDVFAKGGATALVSNLAYGAVSPYFEVPEGAYELEIKATGTTAVAFTTPVIEVTGDKTYTAVAAGFLASQAADDKFRVLAFEEAFTPPGAGKVAVRVVHAAADAPTVGIDVGADDPARPEVASLARFADTGAAGIALPAGAPLRFGITAGGASVTTFSAPALPEGGELFVVAIGRLGDLPRQATGFSLLAVGEAAVLGTLAQDPTVIALHASPDAPSVDIREGARDGLLIGNLAYGQVKSVQVPPGTYDLDFYGAGSPAGTPAATSSSGALVAGQRYLAIASGFLTPVAGEPPFRLIAARDDFELDADSARIGAIHASPDAPVVDIGTATGNVMATPRLVEDLAFGQVAGGVGLEIPAATLRIGVAAANAPNAVATFPLTTAVGLRAFAVATGALTPVGNEQAFKLSVVNTSVWPWTVTAIAPNAN
jgi:Domain of unknown function (DUF4397)